MTTQRKTPLKRSGKSLTHTRLTEADSLNMAALELVQRHATKPWFHSVGTGLHEGLPSIFIYTTTPVPKATRLRHNAYPVVVRQLGQPASDTSAPVGAPVGAFLQAIATRCKRTPTPSARQLRRPIYADDLSSDDVPAVLSTLDRLIKSYREVDPDGFAEMTSNFAPQVKTATLQAGQPVYLNQNHVAYKHVGTRQGVVGTRQGVVVNRQGVVVNRKYTSKGWRYDVSWDGGSSLPYYREDLVVIP